MDVGLSDEMDADWEKGRLGNDGTWKWIPGAPFSQPFLCHDGGRNFVI
jgi:hypothetical protein